MCVHVVLLVARFCVIVMRDEMFDYKLKYMCIAYYYYCISNSILVNVITIIILETGAEKNTEDKLAQANEENNFSHLL